MTNAVKQSIPDASRHPQLSNSLARPVLACLGLGSNIEPEKNLVLAVDMLARKLKVAAVSSVWETQAVGSSGPNFLNAAVLVQTRMTPEALKRRILRPIEARLGRVRTHDKNAPRPIDIDLLVYDGQVIDRNLWRFAHLALPVAELLPDLRREAGGETLSTVARRLRQGHPARLLPNKIIKYRY